ncbi:MAG: hypothetical protein ACYC4Q_02620 [Victivallaceae bacterium]
MGIRFRCRNCNQKYELEDEWAGKVSECLRCGAAMPVPGGSQLSADETLPKSNSIQRAIPVEGLNPMDKIQKLQIVSATAKTGAPDDIIFRCKICQQKYRLPRELAGKVAECAKCRRNMVVPSVSDSSTVKAAKLENNIVFWCKSCGLKYRLSKELAGQRAECTRCKSTFPIPKVSAKEPPAKPDINGTAESSVKLVQNAHEENVQALASAPPDTLSDKEPAASAKVAAPASTVPKNVKNVSPADKVNRIAPDAEKTHTTIEMTKTVTMMVKYVIKLPGSNILFAWASIILDWLAQWGIFRWMPKKAIGYILILIALAGALYFARTFGYEDKGPAKCQIHTLCPKCGQREVMDVLEINDAECSKCKSKVGYAWKCEECGKYFSKADTEKIIINDAKMSRQDKIKFLRPPLCPHCRSSKVGYVAVKDATFG